MNSRDITYISIENLLFDNENPRFARMDQDLTNQKQIAKILWDEMYLEELILSISVSGFYVQEPLLVVPDSDEKYVVVEGNRRLAAVKILTDPTLAQYVKATALPKLTDESLAQLKELPVLVYEDRSKLWSYLSFRHVNGPRGWSSISKAEFVAKLYLERGISFADILGSTGDKNKTSIKLFNGLMVLRQGETQTRFNRSDFEASRFNFSHLYTIIQYPSTRKFLGIEDKDSNQPFDENPIPEEKIANLEDLLVWIFGSKSDKKPSIIKSQNPDLKQLDDVLRSAPALVSLKEDGNLTTAHELTGEEDRRLQELIIRAYNSLQKAVGMASSVAVVGDEDMVKRLKSIKRFADDVLEKASQETDD